ASPRNSRKLCSSSIIRTLGRIVLRHADDQIRTQQLASDQVRYMSYPVVPRARTASGDCPRYICGCVVGSDSSYHCVPGPATHVVRLCPSRRKLASPKPTSELCSSFPTRGSRTRSIVPGPETSSTCIVPPSRSVSRLASVRPKPVPNDFVVKSRSNILLR